LRFLGVIPARGGSKGIQRKNLALLGGRPLISYTCEAALNSNLDEVIVSTDDSEIAHVARGEGVSVPFLRPEVLACDDTPMIKVLQHVNGWLDESGSSIDALVLLQPTSPFRTASDIDRSLSLFEEYRPATLVSVVRVPHRFEPGSLLSKDDAGFVAPLLQGELVGRRQDKPTLYARNGPSILIQSRDSIRQGNLYQQPVLPFEMGALRSLDIDDEDDLKLALALLDAVSHEE
jgi:CMP-N-acetylneuraminic acid synthetase